MRTELRSERRQRFATPMLVQHGCVADVRLLADGRRQILRLTLPGEVLDVGNAACAARDSVTVLTDAILAPIDLAAVNRDEAIASAIAHNAALGQYELLNQIARLGRQLALERTGHLLLELHDRLRLSALATGWRFALGLTQETLADILGLTSVHINRTLQQLRREKLVEFKRHNVVICDPVRLARISDYSFSCYPRTLEDRLPTPLRA